MPRRLFCDAESVAERVNRETNVSAKGLHVATKERLAAMAASRCAVCSAAMVLKLVKADPHDSALELRTYGCAECGHSQTYSVDVRDS